MAGGAYVVIAVCFGLGGGLIGRAKGSSFWMWFFISGAVPIFGLLAALFFPNQHREPRMRCPTCGRVVYVHQTLCTRCGTELYLPEDETQLIPPEWPERG